ncbi:MAG: amino acid permease [Caulobacterales bacterium]|nr:amino acid permease [Caulobacterales bacterium]
MTQQQTPHSLTREFGIVGATFMGLGSIVGTGVFVSIGIAVGEAGPGVLFAIVAAAIIAMCNAFSSAQLAASHPVSGGTYEYGYTYLSPSLGFTAGWMFLCAKTASAATAALGFAGYLLHALGAEASHLILVAMAAVTILTLLVLAGLKRSNMMNILIVSVTLGSLAIFVFSAVPRILQLEPASLLPSRSGEGGSVKSLLYATALMFVAYTGYGRIATMAEEVREPRRVIPQAIIITLTVSAALYIAVALAVVGVVQSRPLGVLGETEAAPLEVIAQALDQPVIAMTISVGAITAMLGVLLNLILGLSRMALAMGRRADLPSPLANVRNGIPAAAVITVGLAVAGLAAVGSIETAWSFSAFTVLVYYAITNLAALRIPARDRLYPRAFPIVGLAGCLFLAFWVPPTIWATGLGLIALGLFARVVFRRTTVQYRQ